MPTSVAPPVTRTVSVGLDLLGLVGGNRGQRLGNGDEGHGASAFPVLGLGGRTVEPVEPVPRLLGVPVGLAGGTVGVGRRAGLTTCRGLGRRHVQVTQRPSSLPDGKASGATPRTALRASDRFSTTSRPPVPSRLTQRSPPGNQATNWSEPRRGSLWGSSGAQPPFSLRMAARMGTPLAGLMPP